MQEQNNNLRPGFYRDVQKIIEADAFRKGAQRRRGGVRWRWRCGRLLVREEKRSDQPAKLLPALARQLRREYGPRFGLHQLRWARSFYRFYPEWSAIAPELSWSHYKQLLRVHEERARAFYHREAVANRWNTRELARQIKVRSFERLVGEQPDHSLRVPYELQVLVRDPYVFEFLQWDEARRLLEKDLENALLDKLQAFMLELGPGFAFVARQQRITTESGKAFGIDLVFYHLHLRCHVLIDLKVGELMHSDIGQMDMYVRLYDHRYRRPGDNPSVGIILCSEKDPTFVKYSVLSDRRRLFAATYRLHLAPDLECPAELERALLHPD